VTGVLQRRRLTAGPGSREWPGPVRALARNWLMTLLLLAGLALRVLAQFAYRPALFYIDSTRYLYHAQGNDPVGYRVPLRTLLLVGNLNLVVAVQHLLGLGMAVAIYAVLRRRGVPGWLAALATAPVLLDAYQLQMEQTIMPDVWFEALIVTGLTLLLWQARLRLPLIAAGGLALGVAVTFRQVGEILILPTLVYLVAVVPGWRRKLTHGLALAGCFALPILAYSTVSLAATGHFWLSHSGTTTIYGRVAEAADCATLRVPVSQRALCPDPRQKALGPDGLEHADTSPLRPYYANLPHSQATSTVSQFNQTVLSQQPARVVGSWLADALKLFAVHRRTAPGDTPLWRWQFQDDYPFYPPHASAQVIGAVTRQFGGGHPRIDLPLARVLRQYQQHGGYTPGPVYALGALAGLAGAMGLAAARRRPGVRLPAQAALLTFGTALALLLMADLFEFSWRYQLPALITLPPAGALGIAVIIAAVRDRRSSGDQPLADAGPAGPAGPTSA
jgi:hypothetical protein